VHLLHHF